MNERQQQILERLHHGRTELSTLAEEFGVSEMTIRRDVHLLEARQLALAVKGGAVLHPSNYEPKSTDVSLTSQKFALAEALYREIMPTESLFIGTGFTVLAFARVLAQRNHRYMTVVTHALSVAASLFRSKARVFLPGGELRSNSLDLVGAIAEREVGEFHVDWLVSGCDGADAKGGFYTSDMNLSRLEQKSISLAEHVAIITESSKFRRRALTCFAVPERIDLLVTDSRLPKHDCELLREKGVRVVQVPCE